MFGISIKAKESQNTEYKVFKYRERNFKAIRIRAILPAVLILISFIFYFSFQNESSFLTTYIKYQKEFFYFLNKTLSPYSNLFYNITQLGDALVIFSFLLFLLFIIPKFWQVLLTSSVITLLLSAVLKRIFAVPRPAAFLDPETFTIVGKTLKGYTSLPSGHSMTTFMVITVVLYAFMPKKLSHKTLWSIAMVSTGLIVAFSRVAVGAHYPFDVIIGSSLGYIAAIIGIRLNRNYNWLEWIKKKRFYPVIMLILSVWAYLIMLKIIKYDLVIFYLSLIATLVTLFIITFKYVKKN